MPFLPGHPMSTFQGFVHTLHKSGSLVRLWSCGMTLPWYGSVGFFSVPNEPPSGIYEANYLLCESRSSLCHGRFPKRMAQVPFSHLQSGLDSVPDIVKICIKRCIKVLEGGQWDATEVSKFATVGSTVFNCL